jgi:hypothetical protein
MERGMFHAERMKIISLAWRKLARTSRDRQKDRYPDEQARRYVMSFFFYQ